MSDKSYPTTLTRPSPIYIGIDLGTSGCRAIAINTFAEVIAEAKIHYVDHNHRQQTPDDWWQATCTVLHSITSKINHQHIQAIAVDGTSSSVLLCDHAGNPLTPAVMYDEQHAKPQVEILKKYAPADSVVLSPTSGLAKALWLIEHHQVQQPFHIVHQADWISGKLSRHFDRSDYNNALKTGYDPVNNVWPLWLNDLFKDQNIDVNSLPHVVSPGTVISDIHPHVAEELSLPIDIEIISGTTDSTAAFLASNATQVGDAVTSLGSTLVLKVISDREINSPEHGVYSQPYGKYWLVGGASNSGGAVLKYYFSEEKMNTLTKHLLPDTPTNFNYYPLINSGERFPINDPEQEPRITPKVDNDVLFFQGLLEGIADIEHTGYKLLEQLGAPYPTSIQTAGGGAVNKAWQKIRQKKLNVPVTIAKQTAAAYGAAMLAKQKYLIQ